MRLPRVDQAIDSCGEHLEKTGAKGTEIEAFLTRHLLVLTCAAFEQEIESLVVERASRSGDEELAEFVRSAVGQLFRSPLTNQILGLLNRFGTACGHRFSESMENNERAETFYNNIVTNRHDTAHSEGANVTFDELVTFYSEGHVVLDAVKDALT